jgi:phosphatidylethanolamine-binding protein (PEBP) family uncharacterized protein
MKVTSNSFAEGSPIPGRFAFAVYDPATHVKLSNNRNPHLAWTDAPAGTRSFAVVCVDPDVPSRGDDVNQEGRTVPGGAAARRLLPLDSGRYSGRCHIDRRG